MKKALCLILSLLLVSGVVYAADFSYEESETVKFPVTERMAFSSIETVDFNSQSISAFWEYKYENWPNTNCDWVQGVTGEETDFAISLVMKNGAVTTQEGEKQDKLYILYCILNDAGATFADGGGTVTFEYDLKLYTDCDRFSMYNIPLWTDNGGGTELDMILFDENGKMVGTDYSYTAGKWMHLLMKADFDARCWNVWIDGEQVLNNKPMAGGYASQSDRLAFFLKQVTEKDAGEQVAGFALDNLTIYAEGKDISEFASLEAEDNSGNKYELDNVFIHPTLKLTISGVKNKALVNSENFVIADEYGNEVPYEGNYKNNVYTMTPSDDLYPNRGYTVKISDRIRNTMAAGRPPRGKITFATGDFKDIAINSVSFTKAPAAGKTAEISYKIANNLQVGFAAGITAVIYNDKNGAEAVLRVNREITAGENEGTLELAIPEGPGKSYTAKLFVTPADGLTVSDEAEID